MPIILAVENGKVLCDVEMQKCQRRECPLSVILTIG